MDCFDHWRHMVPRFVLLRTPQYSNVHRGGRRRGTRSGICTECGSVLLLQECRRMAYKWQSGHVTLRRCRSGITCTDAIESMRMAKSSPSIIFSHLGRQQCRSCQLLQRQMRRYRSMYWSNLDPTDSAKSDRLGPIRLRLTVAALSVVDYVMQRITAGTIFNLLPDDFEFRVLAWVAANIGEARKAYPSTELIMTPSQMNKPGRDPDGAEVSALLNGLLGLQQATRRP